MAWNIIIFLFLQNVVGLILSSEPGGGGGGVSLRVTCMLLITESLISSSSWGNTGKSLVSGPIMSDFHDL